MKSHILGDLGLSQGQDGKKQVILQVPNAYVCVSGSAWVCDRVYPEYD